MPKQRSSPLTPQQIELLGFIQRNEEPLPRNPERLRSLAKVLLLRIRVMDEDLFKRLLVVLRGWTASESQRMASTDGDSLDDIDEAVLRFIAAGVPSKLSHVQSTMVIQWKWLNNYLATNSFPKKARNRVTQLAWVTDRSRDLIRDLGSHYCYCKYPSSLEDWLPSREKPCRTVIEATGYLLAHFHNTTRSNLLKLLKPSQQRRIATSSPQTAHPSDK